MNFKLLKNKEKLKINTVKSNTNDNERTREKFILKEWIESSRKTTCTKNGTRGFLCRLHKLVLNGKMTFSCPTTCTDSYTRRENRCQIPFKTSLTRFKMDFSTGRSMVEMLGVLAIIGVLSIGGIQGYTMAMRRYKANEILNTLGKYATIVYSNCLSAQLNGGAETSISWDKKERLNCSSEILFENAGLGAYPSGMSTNDDHPIQFWDILRTNSGDIVRLMLFFNDQQLCQTVMNIAGIVPVEGPHGGISADCGSDNYPHLILSFIMN